MSITWKPILSGNKKYIGIRYNVNNRINHMATSPKLVISVYFRLQSEPIEQKKENTINYQPKDDFAETSSIKKSFQTRARRYSEDERITTSKNKYVVLVL